MKTSIFVIALAMIAFASGSVVAQTNGPYYATPSWDQTLAVSTRFIVLSNMNSSAVLDRETGLIWEKAPSTSQFTIVDAQTRCLNLQTGGRMGWRLPKSDELFTLVDPTQLNESGMAALPVGNPFIGTTGNPHYWTTDQAAPPVNNNANLIFDALEAGIIQTTDNTDNTVRVWCVRGPGSAQFSP